MRTVEKYLDFNLSEDLIKLFTEQKIINWIGWEWGYDFDKLIDRIAKIPFFDKTKIDSLHKDINLLANEHDISFYIWNSIFAFLKCNYKFSLWIIGILHWTSIWARIIIFISVFLGLSTFGIKFFNWKEKKDSILILLKK